MLGLVCAGVVLLLVQVSLLTIFMRHFYLIMHHQRFELLISTANVEDRNKPLQEPTYSVDVEKRDAVVAAFKVR